MLTAWVSVSTELVGLPVAHRDGVHELVVVLRSGGVRPGGPGVTEVQILRVLGPPSVRQPQGPLAVRSVFLGYYHHSAVLRREKDTGHHINRC